MDILAVKHLAVSRRAALLGLGGLCASTLAAKGADAFIDIAAFGLVADSGADQSDALQATINAAASSGQILKLPAGKILAHGIALPNGTKLTGMPGLSVLALSGDGPLLIARDIAAFVLEDISLVGNAQNGDLMRAENVGDATLSRTHFSATRGNGIYLENSGGRVQDCTFTQFGQSAIHGQNSTSLFVTNNQISDCGNGGIRVWRYEAGHDGTLVHGNRISGIESGSGNGQNGNGINVFQANDVVISSNIITDCAFSAIRLNGTNDVVVSGNVCTYCKEVAIFSEFAFSGSVITDNIVDQAAVGISIANFDNNGRLAICANNIVRNIWPSSPTNPDTVPAGIFAEADAAISNNIVENVPGTGIGAGWGPYLRDVLVNGNIVRDSDVGIVVSVAEGAGAARVSNNHISGARRANIAGMAWTEVRSDDLIRDAEKFQNVTVEGNNIS